MGLCSSSSSSSSDDEVRVVTPEEARSYRNASTKSGRTRPEEIVNDLRKRDTMNQLTSAQLAVKQGRMHVATNNADGLSEGLNRALMRLFETLDRDGDGELTITEAKQYLTTTDGKFRDASDAEQKERLIKFVHDFDADGDGVISLAEWRKRAVSEFVDFDTEDEEEREEMQKKALEYTLRIIECLKSQR